MNKHIRDLQNINENEVILFGGKAVHLAKLIKFKLQVPRGFVISTDANVNDFTREILYKADNVESKYFAVRSSATVEDSIHSSFAGQFKTYLNVSRSDLIESILKCHKSAKSKRVISYCKSKGINTNKIKLAVIVQEMIQANTSGVIFTVHPITHDKNTMLIEAVQGLGEKLVSGRVIPESYEYRKDKKNIFRKGESNSETLGTNQIDHLSRICMKIEKLFSRPQDIEWVLKDNRFWIVQTRPITTL